MSQAEEPPSPLDPRFDEYYQKQIRQTELELEPIPQQLMELTQQSENAQNQITKFENLLIEIEEQRAYLLRRREVIGRQLDKLKQTHQQGMEDPYNRQLVDKLMNAQRRNGGNRYSKKKSKQSKRKSIKHKMQKKKNSS
jgi:hypothetical protein